MMKYIFENYFFCPKAFTYNNPYVGIADPFIIFESSEQRNSMTLDKSPGFIHLVKSALGIALLLASVSIIVGSIQFMLILEFFTSCDTDSTNRIKPDFDAA